jgi:hypothetical protein
MGDPTGEPTDDLDPILAAVAGLDPRADGTTAAFAPLDGLADRLGIDRAGLVPLLADLAAAELVEVCGFAGPDVAVGPGDLHVTLTPYAAERLGVELDRDGLRWQPAGTGPGPEPRHQFHDGRGVVMLATDAAADLDLIVDPLAPDPGRLVDQAEEDDRAVRKRGGNAGGDQAVLPRPQFVIGYRPAWPIAPGRPCPGCGNGRAVTQGVYCAACDRWWLDDLLRSIRRSEQRAGRAKQSRKAYRPDEGLAGGTGAAAAGSRKRARKAHKGQKRGAG